MVIPSLMIPSCESSTDRTHVNHLSHGVSKTEVGDHADHLAHPNKELSHTEEHGAVGIQSK